MNFSIIIPHKNSPELLERCLNSIPIRDDLEIIVVDDNSDSEIVDFIHFPGKERKGVTIVYLKENHGAGYARNIGLKLAQGKWLLFSDADDFYTDKLNDLLNKYSQNNDIDLVYLNAIAFTDDDSEYVLPFSRYINNYKDKRIYSEQVLRFGMWTPWTRMVRRSLVEDKLLQFEEIPNGNDVMFCLNCSKYAQHIEIETNIIYKYYRPHLGSLTDSYRLNEDYISRSLDLNMRMTCLYNSVNYIFKPTFLFSYLKIENGKDKVMYRKKFRALIREKKISVIKNIHYAILNVIGRIFKII